MLAHLHIGDFRCIQQPRHGAVLDDNVRRRSLLTGALLQHLQRPRQIHMEGVPLYRLYNKAQRADTVPVQRELLQICAKNEDDVLICLPDFFGQFHAGHLRHINVQI